jgi:NADH dehydrogenase
MGRHVARNIRRVLRGEQRTPFQYFNKGELATIGRHKAIADFGFFTVTGYAAWFFWLFVHILYLVGFRNRLVVLIQWGYMYLTYRRGVRLITGLEAHRHQRRGLARDVSPAMIEAKESAPQPCGDERLAAMADFAVGSRTRSITF